MLQAVKPAAPLRAPAELARKADTMLRRCMAELRCDINACVSGSGHSGCYSTVDGFWAGELARVEAELDRRDPWCAAHWNELKERQAGFRASALASPTLPDAPFGTNDDLGLQLSRQAYELAHGVLTNSACREVVRPAPTMKGL